MSDIPDQIARELTRIAQLEQELQADSVRDDALKWSALSRRIEQRRSRLFRLQAETHRRLSNGFAVFAFAMVGIPVALWRRSADNASVFFTCLVPIALVYYPLLAAGETIARAGAIPTVSIWLAPAVVTVCGAVMLLRLNWR
jgi:lipopolysaccharide export system permease protein